MTGKHEDIMEPLFDMGDLIEAERQAAWRKAQAGLPASWAALPDGPALRDLPIGKCLYDSPARGFAARVAEFALWSGAYGNCGCSARSHAWQPSSVHFSMYRGGQAVTDFQLDRHECVPLDCDLRRHRYQNGTWEPVPPCGHDAGAETGDGWRGLLYRGACRKAGCDWEGPVRDRENPAVEDGMDHAWPGWRHLPPVPKVPDQVGSGTSKAAMKSVEAWTAKVIAVYPDGWLEAGGPIRTVREPMGTRHVAGRTPYGGYDLALTCHLCGRAEGLTWLTGGGVTVAGCTDGCPQGGNDAQQD